METWKRVLGDKHLATLHSMHNLASIYLNQEQWKEAEELVVQVVETRKRVLGEENPKTLAMINEASGENPIISTCVTFATPSGNSRHYKFPSSPRPFFRRVIKNIIICRERELKLSKEFLL